MSHPSTVTSERWIRTYPTTILGIMSCHWTDVDRGYVVPKFPGQIFQFVDLDEFWMYIGTTEDEGEVAPAPVRSDWVGRAVLLACFGLVGFELFLIWQLYETMKEIGVL